MRKIIAGLFISLDGVVEAPETWHFPYFNDEMGEAVSAQAAQSDTMLLGRKTYEAFAAFWPNEGRNEPFGDVMNGTPKLVASTTLTAVDWENSTLIEGDVVEALRHIKQGPGKDISITGSPTLVRSLLRAGILDELRLLVHPIVVGHGIHLFTDEEQPIPLKLLSSTTFSTGVQSMVYGPAEPADETAGADETAPAVETATSA
jgi:dihydrofolate reductase